MLIDKLYILLIPKIYILMVKSTLRASSTDDDQNPTFDFTRYLYTIKEDYLRRTKVKTQLSIPLPTNWNGLMKMPASREIVKVQILA